MKSTKSFKKKYLKFSFINAIIVLILFLFIQKIYFLPGSDSKIFFYGPIIKNKIFKKKHSLNPSDYLLINTHFDNMLVDNYDEYDFPMGNTSIVDREKLIRLFKKIEKAASHKYIICDISFEDKSVYDDTLAYVLKRTKDLILPRKNNLNSTLEPFRGINSGLVDIYTVGGTFYKYKLLNDKSKIKSIPLIIYEDLNNSSISPFYIFSTFNKSIIFNDFVPEHRFNNYNVFETKEFPLLNLGDIINVSNDNFKNYIDNRIILIGNYNSDMKSTIYGSIPGPLILLNSYLSLENKENKITFFLLLTLFLVFFGFSYLVISPQDKIETNLLKIPIIGGLLLGTGYIFIMSIFSLVIYFIFGNNLNLSYVALLFYLQNLILNRTFYLKRFKNKFN